jgi:DNA-binding Xre family transcriptional regulator
MPRKSKASVKTGLAASDFFSILKTHMKREGIRKTELAKRLDCSPANVTMMFNKSDVMLSTMCEFCEALGLEFRIEFVVHKNVVKFAMEQRTDQTGATQVYVCLSDLMGFQR